MYAALIEEAIAKAPDAFCLFQMNSIYLDFRKTGKLPQADIELLNEVAFKGKSMWWSEAKGFEPK